MAQEWYISRLGQVYGPLSGDELAQWAAAGQLKPEDFVWHEGLSEWVPAASLPGLVSQGPPPPPPAPTQPPPPLRVSRQVTPLTPPRRPAVRRGLPVAWIAIFFAALLAAGWGGWMLRGAGGPTGDAPNRSRQDRVTANHVPQAPSTATQQQANPPDIAKQTPSSNATQATTQATETPEKVKPRDAKAPGGSLADTLEPTQPPTSKGTPDAPPATEPKPQAGKPEATKLKSAGTRTLYQDVVISRRPSFAVAGLTISQDLRYRVFSKLTISPKDSDGSFTVRQMIYETKLQKSEGLSQAIFAASLKALQSQELRYTLNHKHEIVKFTGPKDTRKTAPIDGLGGQGFLLTSVMDDDGWRELAQLTFFQPPEPLSKRRRWDAKITHDWGPLGSWYGKTSYTYAQSEPDGQHIDYVHRMTYVPPGKGRKETPFEITSAEFKPLETGGRIYYDTAKARVKSVTEKFHVRGMVNTMLLGQTSAVGVEEIQVFSIRVLDEEPAEDKGLETRD